MLSTSLCFGQNLKSMIKEVDDSLAQSNVGFTTEELVDEIIIEASRSRQFTEIAFLLKAKIFDKKFDSPGVLSVLKPNAKKVRNDSIRAIYFYMIGRAHGILGEIDSSLKYLDIAEHMMLRQNNLSGLINVHNSKGFLYFNALQEDKAFREYENAIQLMVESGDSTIYLPVMNNAAACLMRLGDIQSAKLYYKDLLREFGKDNPFIGQVYANLGVAYSEQDSNEVAEQYFLQAIEPLDRTNNMVFLGTVYFNLINLSIEKGQLDEALEYANLAEPIITLTQPSRLGYLYEAYADISLKSGKEEDAVELYMKAINYAEKYEQWSEASSSAIKLSSYYEEKSIYDEALEYSKKHNEFKDRFLEERKLNAIEKYRVSFETDRKEFEISKLQELNEANRLRLRAQNRIQLLIAGIGLGLLLVSVVITILVMRLRLHRMKLANHVKLSELNNKLAINRLSPHFVFNILNSIQFYINSNDRKNANHYLTKFAALLRKFLDSFSEDFHSLEEELDLIREYVELEQMLKNNSFQFEFTIDPDVDVTMIFPTMLLQPVIENAIKHGTTDDNPMVKVRINKIVNGVECLVEDNGMGILEDANAHRSRGIEMSRQRIELLSATTRSNFKLLMENKDEANKGLLVKLTIQDQKDLGNA